MREAETLSSEEHIRRYRETGGEDRGWELVEATGLDVPDSLQSHAERNGPGRGRRSAPGQCRSVALHVWSRNLSATDPCRP